jgi:protocatechuate 3,4-dioxygenase beta subunit
MAPALLRGVLSSGAAEAASRCARLTPELTEGPYWVNAMLRRADVRANTKAAKSSPGLRQKGVPLDLTIDVLDASRSCKPFNGVAVDIWHANAHGLYSDEASQQAGGATNAGDTSGEDFLRGYQISGRDRGIHRAPVAGQVSFRTIWPGWYTGRAIHIHVRVRKLSTSGATIAGYTTQIFFSDADNDRVLTGAAPYSSRSPQSDPTTDENDNVLHASEYATNLVPVKGSIHGGFKATFSIVLDDAQAAAMGA